jgi:TatD DNase family protein
MELPVLFDSHTHIHTLEPADTIDAVMKAAEAAGVHQMLTIGVNVEDSRRALALAEQHPSLHAAVGIHPTDASKAGDADVPLIAEMLDHPKAVAIGEIGLDYYWDFSTPEDQHRILRAMLTLAVESDLPVVLHNRESTSDLLAIIGEQDFTAVRGVWHCFAGTREEADIMLDRGYYISFAGNVTFKKYDALEVAATVPNDRLLVETDTPYLAPVPHRGKPNEPSLMRHTIDKLAELRQTDSNTIAELTARNAATLFRTEITDAA